MASGLTETQLGAISNIERSCSVLSLAGSVFVIATFCLSSSFHKPVNRLVFYATFGNMLTNVGTLMSRTYLRSPNSVGCQLQAFLIQMFMPADAFWTLAMAINVYLTFYYRFDAQRLRKMEIPYLVVCYGVPFVPALTYIFLEDRGGNRVYGDAVLWCWVTTEWNIWRILTFYGPVWILILVTFFIYIRAGRTIYYKRKQLQEFSISEPDPVSAAHAETMTTIKTTEITVTSTEAGCSDGFPLQNMSHLGPEVASGGYTVTVATSGHHSQIPSKAGPSQPPKTATSIGPAVRSARRRNYEVNNAAWAYTKCAILFFTALLITWIPSSANRLYSFIHPSTLPALEFMSAFVLPLQGFWNAVIYTITSWTACKNLWGDLRHTRRAGVTQMVGGAQSEDSREEHANSLSQTPWRRKRNGESESMTELANSDSHSEH